MYVYYVRSNLLTNEITLLGLQLKQQQAQHAAVQGQGLASVHPQLSVVVEEKSDELSAPASANSSCDSRKNRSGCCSSDFILLAFSKSLLKSMAIITKCTFSVFLHVKVCVSWWDGVLWPMHLFWKQGTRGGWGEACAGQLKKVQKSEPEIMTGTAGRRKRDQQQILLDWLVIDFHFKSHLLIKSRQNEINLLTSLEKNRERSSEESRGGEPAYSQRDPLQEFLRNNGFLSDGNGTERNASGSQTLEAAAKSLQRQVASMNLPLNQVILWWLHLPLTKNSKLTKNTRK